MSKKSRFRVEIGIFMLLICLWVSHETCIAAEGENLKDGTYQIEVTMTGGSGRATIASPTKLVVKNGKATAEIKWSSSNYDYMIMDGVTYQPVSTDPVSVFHLPIAEFDQEIAVVGDTTAMSVPHEIEYSLCFHRDSIKEEGAGHFPVLVVILVMILAAGLFYMIRRKKKKNGSK